MKIKKLIKIDTWVGNFKRGSTQLFTAIAALNTYQWLPDAIAAARSGMKLYEPILSPGVYAGVMMALAVTGAIVRNLKRAEDDT